jgi:signal transduction histidine kinase/ligand-binding sensor domain-containing protein/DNA-binding response OmpR family regulator
MLAQENSKLSTNFPEPIFEHLTIADGLPENSVRVILQDHLGYMWFGTQNGLVKYDGYNMKVYQSDPDDSLSISDRHINAIYEDKSGTLWIGTAVGELGGLNRFDRQSETFTRYLHSPADSTSINSNFVLSIYEDKAGNFWIGTMEGLNLFDRQNESFRHIHYKDSVYSIAVSAFIEDQLTGDLYVASNNKILAIEKGNQHLTDNNRISELKSNLGEIKSFHQSPDETLWIGHSKGLARFSSINNTFKYYQPSQILNSSENKVDDLMEDEYGLIWGSCNGLISFDPEKELFKRYKDIPDKQGILSSNAVFSVYKDQSGIIWVGTGWQGLNKWDRNKNKFKRFSFDPNNPDSDHFNLVYIITEDQKGNIWFGTNDGLYYFNNFTNEFYNFKYNSENKNNSVNNIYSNNSEILFFGSRTRGLGKFDVARHTFSFYSNNPYDSTTISSNTVNYILPDKNDILWIGTGNGGLNRFNKKTGKFTRYTHNPNNSKSLSNNTVYSILKDRKGTLWVGTNGRKGLNRFNQADESFTSFNFPGGTATAEALYEDHQGNFWVGTYLNGIYLFDRNSEAPIDNITQKDGLANNQVKSILEDDNGNLWISTANGLSKFDPETRNIKNYFSSDGIEENNYWNQNAYRTSTGEMLFGTSDGFIMFHPDSIKDDPVPPKVVISNVSLFNRPGEELICDEFISEMEELELSYNENDLHFDYVGLHLGEPEKNRYKYMLENFDNGWIDAGTQRNATYTNLDAGEYVFRVTACNRDGVWNEEGASLKIIIPAPFWASWWAYSFYFLIGLGLLYSIRRYEINRLRWKNQSKLDEVELKERKETDKMKSRFFANISHEFRTPLTLILGPAEKIKPGTTDEEILKQTGVIKRNTKRLLGLVNQLLDLSKLEAGKLELRATNTNIVSFLKGITLSFESVAEGKDITLRVKTSNDEIELYFDKEKMTKIIMNLLMNAFKFTKDGGQITVTINKVDTNFIKIKIKDTGAGIAEEEIPKLFDRFYQVDSSQTREHEGTGIGLALTKELVELHNGTITVNSKLGEGTEFTIHLPVGRAHLKDEEIVITGELKKEEVIVNNEEFVPSTVQAEVVENKTTDEDKNIILIVEDNADVRDYIKDSLGNDFQIEEAANGEQGVRKAEQIIPDLIVSDIMMPKMNGNELTRILRNDEKTSHIPIILLTAKSEQESKLEGIETGADDYLTKPFDTKELQIRIKNLISVRKKLQEKFSKRDYIPVRAEEKKLSNLEEQFMCRVMEVIENHLSEEDFSIEKFGKEVGMSRVQLHRKLKALSGKSASHYLRSARLSKAKKLIEEKKGSISEIAYSVGFSSPQYFTRCFKEEFGFSPSDLSS